MFKEQKKCRVCSSERLQKYLSLGAMPLANNLVELNRQETDMFFPLEVQFCNNCKLSQLTIVVNPEIMFSEYSYRTSVSSTFRKHFEEMAREVKKLFSETEKPLALDIGSNDGCLLEGFEKQGFRVLGVEPAGNLAKIANGQGIETIPGFWNEQTSKKILKEKGNVQIVTATNVFAHVDDVHAFIQNVESVLSKGGIFIIEVPHALNLVTKNEFDTIYHEHLSYFLVKPLLFLFEKTGMEVFDVERVPTHGGSIRVFAKQKENKKIIVEKEKINAFILEEERNGLYEIAAYKKFAEKTMKAKKDFVQLLQELKKQNKKIAGYAASAKASTLLNYCGIGKETIGFIIDDAPEKQNRAFAGNRVPIVANSWLEKEKPDILVIFAWNIAKEIMQKINSNHEWRGKYVIPMPFPRIIESEREL